MTTRRALAPPPKVPLPRLSGQDYPLQRVQKFVEQATEKARKDQHAKGNHVQLKVAAAGLVTVAHKLGRKPNNMTVTDRQGGAVAVVRESWNSRTAQLSVSGGPATLDLWFY